MSDCLPHVRANIKYCDGTSVRCLLTMDLVAPNFGRNQRALRTNGIVLFFSLLEARPFLGAYTDTQGWGSLCLWSLFQQMALL